MAARSGVARMQESWVAVMARRELVEAIRLSLLLSVAIGCLPGTQAFSSAPMAAGTHLRSSHAHEHAPPSRSCSRIPQRMHVEGASRRAFLTAASLLPLAIGTSGGAATGQFAKIDVAQFVDDVYGEDKKKGPSLYDAQADAVRKQRTKVVRKAWDKMISEVDTALESKNLATVQGALSLRMGTIKSSMREISRIAAGGDILVRDKGEGKSANFDYSTGTFEYKAVAQTAEDMFTAINRMYEKCKTKDHAAALAEWEDAKGLYTKWLAMAE